MGDDENNENLSISITKLLESHNNQQMSAFDRNEKHSNSKLASNKKLLGQSV